MSDFLWLLERVGSEIRFVANCAKQMHCRAWEPGALVIRMVCFSVEKKDPLPSNICET